MPPDSLTFSAVRARQSANHVVLSFAATAPQIQRFARIQRVGRTETGDLFGFQRPQVGAHIREIRDYMAREDAVVPNSIVVAFIETEKSIAIKGEGTVVEVAIDVSGEPRGLVVDGQQRLSALAGLPDRDIELFVSALVCRDEEELRRQFILINNTRPLPKGLIYELLPSVAKLPLRLSSRTQAAHLTERLNYRAGPLFGQINQHTNPAGRIKDTAVQTLIMNSLADGAMRELINKRDGETECLRLVNNFFIAITEVFERDWQGHTPKTSRLVHGAGIVAMGHVMEELVGKHKAHKVAEFREGLRLLVGHTAWSSGNWHFDEHDRRPWNRIQNTNRDILLLTEHLLKVLKKEIRKRSLTGGQLPLLVGVPD
jgi:DGQHR domain-containing protein